MFYWDPRPEFFVIPYIDWPISWYGLLFMLGFALGVPIFSSILRRFFFNDEKYIPSDILSPEKIKAGSTLNSQIDKEVIHSLPDKIKNDVKKSNCLHPKKTLARLSLDQELGDTVLGIYRKATLVTDRIIIYIMIATVIGARVGHFLFYEKSSDYWEMFQLDGGGLAGLSSHGAALGIILGIVLFSYRIKKIAHHLTWIRLLDFVCIPTALCGAFIRIGNFINQEILGSRTSLPWGVIFGHPADHSFPTPRHPVQLYEAFFYLFVFYVLWRLTYRYIFLISEGKLIGVFLILVFGFRFFIEFIKLEQSQLLTASFLTMGQILSVPLVLLGTYFVSRKASKAL